MNTDNKTNPESIDINQLVSPEKTFPVVFAGIEFDVRILTPAEKKAALRMGRKMGTSKKNPKYDEEKTATSMCCMAIVGWRREGGGIVVNNGEELVYNEENKKFLVENLAGLDVLIIEHCTNADKMFALIDEDEVKN